MWKCTQGSLLSPYFKKYTSPAYLACGSSDNGEEFFRAMIMYTETPFHSATEAFKSELLLIKAPSRECGMCQTFVAANVLHARVTSVFPVNGMVDVRNLCMCTVLAEVELSEPRFIMWTSSHVDTVDDYWLGTHFVPLIPLGESVMVIAEGDDCEDEFNSAFLRRQLCQPQHAIPCRTDTKCVLCDFTNVVFLLTYC